MHPDLEAYLPRAQKIVTKFLETNQGWRYIADDIRGEVNLRVAQAWEKIDWTKNWKQICAFLDRAVNFGIRDAVRANGGSTGRYRKNQLNRVEMPSEI
jgi:hypothetical protein